MNASSKIATCLAFFLIQACTVTQDQEPASSSAEGGAGGQASSADLGGGGVGGGSEQGPSGPLSSADSLAAQQEAQGWGAAQCSAPPAGVEVGYLSGQQIGALSFKDCEGNDVTLNDICGASGTWMFLAHGWCPHCRLTSSIAEEVHDGFSGRGLASLNVLVESASHQPPTAEDCKAWRETYAHDGVITLYDPVGASGVLWEQNSTSLNVFLDKDRIVATKNHTDSRLVIEANIERSLP